MTQVIIRSALRGFGLHGLPESTQGDLRTSSSLGLHREDPKAPHGAGAEGKGVDPLEKKTIPLQLILFPQDSETTLFFGSEHFQIEAIKGLITTSRPAGDSGTTLYSCGTSRQADKAERRLEKK
ncbi:uncharacterized protein LOC144293996 [Canis aureus]